MRAVVQEEVVVRVVLLLVGVVKGGDAGRGAVVRVVLLEVVVKAVAQEGCVCAGVGAGEDDGEKVLGVGRHRNPQTNEDPFE